MITSGLLQHPACCLIKKKKKFNTILKIFFSLKNKYSECLETLKKAKKCFVLFLWDRSYKIQFLGTGQVLWGNAVLGPILPKQVQWSKIRLPQKHHVKFRGYNNQFSIKCPRQQSPKKESKWLTLKSDGTLFSLTLTV